jgi:acyl carrier protein
MTPAAIKTKALELLARIVPELDPQTLRTNQSLRDQLDIDSMDGLNFLVALHEGFGVDIPEADYRKLATIDALVEYLGARLPSGFDRTQPPPASSA